MLSQLCVSTAATVIRMSIRTYSELIQIPTYKERFEYLSLDGQVGRDTFGYDRYLNQIFYRSQKWKSIRDRIIIRDNGCDLAMEGYDIYSKIIIHHMNPITIKDIELESDYLMDPEFLICVTHNTHNAIHYSDSNLLITAPIERTKNDTCPWRRN